MWPTLHRLSAAMYPLRQQYERGHLAVSWSHRFVSVKQKVTLEDNVKQPGASPKWRYGSEGCSRGLQASTFYPLHCFPPWHPEEHDMLYDLISSRCECMFPKCYNWCGCSWTMSPEVPCLCSQKVVSRGCWWVNQFAFFLGRACWLERFDFTTLIY